MSKTTENGAAAAAEVEPRKATSYVVFAYQVEEGAAPVLVSIGEGEGLNDVAAVKAVTGAADIQEGQFVAIPKRSLRVRTIKAEVTRRVSIS